LNLFLDYKKGIGEVQSWMSTFTRFTNVFWGKQISNEELLAFWNCVTFYNYVQKAIIDSRTSPNEQDFEDSKIAFFEVLKEYKPEAVIGTGGYVCYPVLKKAAKAGFDWQDAEGVIAKIQEELEEVKEQITINKTPVPSPQSPIPVKLEEELGDLLFSVINLCRFLEVEPSIALRRTNVKFVKRFNYKIKNKVII
jgi:NTP pyrophosphatase (non-canonical NTP hydrolase)